MNNIWLEKWTWAKLYTTVNSSVDMISCLNCTVQLTVISIVNNLKRNFKHTEIVKVHDIATRSCHLALHEVCRKTTELSKLAQFCLYQKITEHNTSRTELTHF